jgi:PAS domain S-box-containing protein
MARRAKATCGRRGAPLGDRDLATESIPEPALLVEEKGRVLAASPGVRSLLGPRAATPVGRSIVDLVLPAHRRRVRDEVRRAAAGRRRRFEIEVFGSRGEPTAVAVHAGPALVRPAAVLILRDLREERRREAELERKGQALEVLARILTDVSEATTVREVCRAACQHLAALFGPAACAAAYLEEPGGILRAAAVAGSATMEAARLYEGPEPPMYKEARRAGKTVVVLDLLRDPLTRRFRKEIRAGPFRAAALATLGRPGRECGFVCVATPEADDFAADRVRFLSEVGRAAGIAIENLDRFDETRRQLEDTKLVRDVSIGMVATLPLEPLLQRVAHGLARLVDVEQCFILLYDPEAEVLTGVASTLELRDLAQLVRIPVKGGASLAVTAWRARRAIAVEDARRDPRTNKRLVRFFRERSLLCAPLLVGERAIGVVMLAETRGIRTFRPDEIARVETVANQAALAIENARRLADALRARDRAELLLDVVRTASGTVDMRECLSHVAEQLVKLTAATFCLVLIPDASGKSVADMVRYGGPFDLLENIRGLFRGPPARAGFLCRVFEAERTIVVRDPVREGVLSARYARRHGLSHMLLVPVRANGHAVAALVLGYGAAGRLDEEDVAITEGVARQVALAVAKARAFEEIARQQRALDMLTARTIAAQEDERRRLARELHDGVSQALTAVKITFERVLRGISIAGGLAPPEAIVELERGTRAVGEAIREVRRICMDLRPSQLDHLGFAATIEWYSKSFRERSGLEVRVDIGELPPLPPETEINLYRIVQEALSNIEKHAGARHVDLRVREREGSIVLTIRDDGCGFDPQRVERRGEAERGLGLLTMAERAHLLCGELRVRAAEGRGTTVEVSVPARGPAPVAAEGALARSGASRPRGGNGA